MTETCPKYVEDTIFDEIVPNTFVLLNRLKEVLKEIGTNSLLEKTAQQDLRVRKLMWLLNAQMHDCIGDSAEFDAIIKADTTEFSKKLK